METLRGFREGEVPPAVANKFIRRQEFVSVSLYKRTLGSYRSIGEVARAVADGFRGAFDSLPIYLSFPHCSYSAIVWLDKHGYIHRDLSEGNLLLAQESPTSFTRPREVSLTKDGTCIPLNLVRQQVHEPPDVFGVIPLEVCDIACFDLRICAPDSSLSPSDRTPILHQVVQEVALPVDIEESGPRGTQSCFP